MLGMTCAACTSAVEGTLMRVRGVVKASVSLTQGEAEVQYDAAITKPVGYGRRETRGRGL